VSGTAEGGQTLLRTMYRKHGSKEKFSQATSAIGRIGGSSTAAQGTIKGFALDRKRARRAGAIGGSRGRPYSSRGKKKATKAEKRQQKARALLKQLKNDDISYMEYFNATQKLYDY
jgi:hypothetical protein